MKQRNCPPSQCQKKNSRHSNLRLGCRLRLGRVIMGNFFVLRPAKSSLNPTGTQKITTKQVNEVVGSMWRFCTQQFNRYPRKRGCRALRRWANCIVPDVSLVKSLYARWRWPESWCRSTVITGPHRDRRNADRRGPCVAHPKLCPTGEGLGLGFGRARLPRQNKDGGWQKQSPKMVFICDCWAENRLAE